MLLQNDAIVRETVGIPELAGNERFGGAPVGVEFQHVAHTEAFYGYMLFSKITIEWRLTANFRGHVLSVLRWGRHHRTVRLMHANVVDVHALGRVLIRKSQQGVALHARVRLDANSGGGFSSPGPIVFEDNSRGGLLDDKRLGRVIRLGVWLRGCLCVAAVDREGEGQKNNEGAQINEHNGGKYLTCFQQKGKLFLLPTDFESSAKRLTTSGPVWRTLLKSLCYFHTSGAIAQSGRAPRSQRGGRRFEPD